MLLTALAFDYDGTLAHHGRVDAATIEALVQVRNSGRRLLMVSGRELPDLRRVFERLDLFDAVVVENGALLHIPATREERQLGPTPPPEFVEALRRAGVDPLSVGRCIVATWEPNEGHVLKAIHELGLEWQIIFNKGAVMCLPPGINKASGLLTALDVLDLSPLNVLGVGDAENDHAFLSACGVSAAVANALDALKAEADIVTAGDHGAGVIELVERLLRGPPGALTAAIRRHDVELGVAEDGAPVRLSPSDGAMLIAGGSGMGKSRLATALIERIRAQGFQYCVVDPEGDYDGLEKTAALGGSDHAPDPQEALQLLRRPADSASLNLLGAPPPDRAGLFSRLMTGLSGLRAEYGRPHWIILDEAHHLLPAESDAQTAAMPSEAPGVVFITVNPQALSMEALATVATVAAVGPQAQAVIADFCAALELSPPAMPQKAPDDQHLLFWRRDLPSAVLVRAVEPAQEHQRHIRKYAAGELGEDKSFYFRGPRDALNLRAQNLTLFLQIAEGVDDETWLHHLRRREYSRWFREAIGDAEMAAEAEAAEERYAGDAAGARRAIAKIVSRRYTAPATS